MKNLIFGILGAIFLSSCGGSLYQRDPVGVGYDNAEMKMSPCACILVPQDTATSDA